MKNKKREKMQCPSDEKLFDFAVDALEESEFAEIATHISTCTKCQDETTRLKNATVRFASIMKAESPDFLHVNEDSAKLPERAFEQIKLSITTIDKSSQGEPQTGNEPRAEDPVQSGTANSERAIDWQIKTIGKYKIKETLGHGGQATAFLAYDPDLERQVVLKRYREVALSEDQVRKDGRLICRVDSPFVAQCHDVYRHDEETYLVIEYIRGLTLEEWCEKKQPTIDESVSIMGDIAHGLSAIHRCGLVHRDIKPANIVIGSDRKPRIIDFGIATQIASEDLSRMAGTFQYMSPEQANVDSTRIDQRTDIFSLGAVMYRMLTGRPPYQSFNPLDVIDAAKHADFKPPREINPDISVAIEQICLKAMSADPSQRYSTPAEFHSALMRKGGKGQYPKLVAILLILAIVVVGLILFFGPGNDTRNVPMKLDGRVDVVLFSADQNASDAKRGVSIRTKGALPAQSGESVRIHVQLSQPSYTYLFWIDAKGTTVPLYPWNTMDDVKDVLPDMKAKKTLQIPSELNKGFPLSGPSGLESVILLARRQPLPQSYDFASFTKRLPPRPMHDSLEWTVIDLDSNTVEGPDNRTRSIDVSKKTFLNDELLHRLSELRFDFDKVILVRFAFVGDPK